MSSAMCFISATVIYYHFRLFASYWIDMANKEAICFRAGSFDILFDVGWDGVMLLIVFYPTSCNIQTTARWSIQCCFFLCNQVIYLHLHIFHLWTLLNARSRVLLMGSGVCCQMSEGITSNALSLKSYDTGYIVLCDKTVNLMQPVQGTPVH